jgi:type III secretion protein T
MSYTDYLFNLPHITWMGILTLYLLSLMRLAPIVVLAPFFGAKAAPVMARVAVILSLGAVFLPLLATRAIHPLGFDNAFLGYALKELLIGFILGFFVTIPFYMIQTSGIIIDYLRGSSIMQAQDPAMQNQASPIGILYNYILIVIFFEMDGPYLFINSILKSYDLIPVDGFINPLFFNPNNPFWKTSFDLLNFIISLGIQLAAPAIVAILMAEMFLGIANRLAPQVQIAFLGMSLKSLLGISLLWAAWFFILKQLNKESYDWLKLIDNLIQSLRLLVPKT